MKKESLNEFYEAEQFHKKLRERIDGHEPELSDSLWDRIEHDLNRKENNNRKVLWLVYVLSGLLLVSGGALFYLWGENQKLNSNSDLIVQEEVNPEMSGSNTIENSEEGASVQQGNQSENLILAETYTAGANTPPSNTPRSISQYSSPRSNQAGTLPLETEEPEKNAATASNTNTTNSEPIIPNLPILDTKGEVGIDPNPQVEMGENSEGVIELTTKEEEKKKESTPPVTPPTIDSKRPSIFATTYVGMNKVNQKANYFEHEISIAEYGFNFGVKWNCGLSISSGIASYVTGQKMQFNIRKVPSSSGIPGTASVDSIFSGNENELVNKQYWIEVPVMIGYSYSLNRWSINAAAGAGFNLINGFSGSAPTSNFSGFESDGKFHSQPYRDFVSLKTSLGINYALLPNLQIGAGATYRAAMSSSTTTPEDPTLSVAYPERRPSSLGGMFSITYLFK